MFIHIVSSVIKLEDLTWSLLNKNPCYIKKKKKEEQDIAGFLLGLALSLLISIKERNTGGIFAV